MLTPTSDILDSATRRSLRLSGLLSADTEAGRAASPILPNRQDFDIFARETAPKSASWAIWWSDLMMTMFIMFAALYIFQMPKAPTQVQPRQSQTAVNQVLAPRPYTPSLLDRLHDQIHSLIEAKRFGAWISVQAVPGKSVRILLKGNLFETDKHVLQPQVKTALSALAAILRTAPYAVGIVGHNQGAAANLWETAALQATRAATFLAQEGQIPTERIFVVGYAKKDPRKDIKNGAQHLELILSAENPTEPLSEIQDRQDGFRQWLANSVREEH